MKPEIWGNHAWLFLHGITMNYTPNRKNRKAIYNFFKAMRYVLPCSKCSKNLKKHMKKIPLTKDILKSRERLIEWLIDIHNEVNKSIGKPLISYDTALRQFEQIRNQ